MEVQIRGKVLDHNDNPLPGVMIEILNHPEFGYTYSRTDGMFDMAVNGGNAYTISYSRQGYISVQRRTQTSWQRFVMADDVDMIPLDSAVSVVDLTSAQPIQIVRGSLSQDSDGSRRATLLFPKNTVATVQLAGGGSQILSTLSVRATEFTVGPNGQKAMPADLPPTSSYTYAVNLSVDEAEAVGAKHVTFSQPVPFYFENFLGFPTGGSIPVGYYDSDLGVWAPSHNGRVIKILSTTGGITAVDVDGSGQPASSDTLTRMGFTVGELISIASLYHDGQTVVRVPLTHFSTIDCNNPNQTPPSDTDPPTPTTDDNNNTKTPCAPGSIIECENQSLGESIAIQGTPYKLYYSSKRMNDDARQRTIHFTIPASSNPDLLDVSITTTIAGRTFVQNFDPTQNIDYNFTWDGKDAFGRMLKGKQPATVVIGYEYAANFVIPVGMGPDDSFMLWGKEYTYQQAITTIPARSHVVKSTDLHFYLAGGEDESSDRNGGWTFSVNHSFDVQS